MGTYLPYATVDCLSFKLELLLLWKPTRKPLIGTVTLPRCVFTKDESLAVVVVATDVSIVYPFRRLIRRQQETRDFSRIGDRRSNG